MLVIHKHSDKNTTHTNQSGAPCLILEEFTGMGAIVRQLDVRMSKLQQERTMSIDEIRRALAKEGKATGMGGFETVDEIRQNAHNPGYRVIAVVDPKTGEVEGFQDFSLDRLNQRLYAVYDQNRFRFPPHLQHLTEEDIGFAGTVVMDKELTPGQYKKTHAVMVSEERTAGKKLIVDVCFELNEGGLRSHAKKGYQVLKDENNQPIKVSCDYHTKSEAGKELVFIWCDPNTKLQDDLIRDFNAGRVHGDFRFLDYTPCAA